MPWCFVPACVALLTAKLVPVACARVRNSLWDPGPLPKYNHNRSHRCHCSTFDCHRHRRDIGVVTISTRQHPPLLACLCRYRKNLPHHQHHSIAAIAALARGPHLFGVKTTDTHMSTRVCHRGFIIVVGIHYCCHLPGKVMTSAGDPSLPGVNNIHVGLITQSCSSGIFAQSPELYISMEH